MQLCYSLYLKILPRYYINRSNFVISSDSLVVPLNPYSAKGLGDRLYATLHKMPEEVVYSFFFNFWSRKTLPYTHLEATSYIPQQGQSVHIWTTSLSTTGCYKNKYNIQFLWMVCTSRFATAILSRETKLALCTIRVKENRIKLFQLNQTDLAGMLGAARRSALSWYPRMSDILLPCRTEPRCLRHTTIHLKLQKQNIF